MDKPVDFHNLVLFDRNIQGFEFDHLTKVKKKITAITSFVKSKVENGKAMFIERLSAIYKTEKRRELKNNRITNKALALITNLKKRL